VMSSGPSKTKHSTASVAQNCLKLSGRAALNWLCDGIMVYLSSSI
jgi:hypothetical protein